MIQNKMLPVIGIVILTVGAGCGGIGGLVGGGPASFTADEITITDNAISQTGFKLVSAEQVSFERSLEVGGQSKTVVINAHAIHVQRTYRGAPLGTAVLVSLPRVKLLGQQIDAASLMNQNDLMSRASGDSSQLTQQQKIEEQSAQILGASRTITVYRGTATRDGQSAKVRIYRTQFSYQDNTIVATAVIPRAADDQQSPLRLFQGIRAP